MNDPTIPQPDPAWDYAPIWEDLVILQRLHQQTDEIVSVVGDSEAASTDIDGRLRSHLQQIQLHTNAILSKLPQGGDRDE